jgi:uncharacterized RDD family membrane protein YckC
MTGNSAKLQDHYDEKAFGGFWIRTGAYIIDYLILLIPTLVLQIALGNFMQKNTIPFFLVMVALLFFMNFVYFGLYQAEMEGSIGKKAMGLRLVTERGEKMNLSQATIRFFVARLTAVAFGPTYFSIGWNPFKQGWHDRVANTVVIKAHILEEWRKNREVIKHSESA